MIRLSEKALKDLVAKAKDEHRDPRQQAALLLERSLSESDSKSGQAERKQAA